jgi:hypothetical protein
MRFLVPYLVHYQFYFLFLFLNDATYFGTWIFLLSQDANLGWPLFLLSLLVWFFILRPRLNWFRVLKNGLRNVDITYPFQDTRRGVRTSIYLTWVWVLILTLYWIFNLSSHSTTYLILWITCGFLTLFLFVQYTLRSCWLSYCLEGKVLNLSLTSSNERSLCHLCFHILSCEEVNVEIPCGHFFHQACIDLWFMHSLKCPECHPLGVSLFH